jgi:integration host factor subunit beta
MNIYILICKFLRRLPMNKHDLILTLKNETRLTKSEAKAVVNLFFNEMSKALANGDRVEVRGLCTFYVKKYKAYIGRNPKTGEKVDIQQKKLPFFKQGKELKKRVDNL